MREKEMVNLRFLCSLLVFQLLLLMCDQCNAVKDLKETHSAASFYEDCDQAEEKSNSSPSPSYIKRLESKYKPGYIMDEEDDKSSSLSSYILRLQSKYKPGYVVDRAEEKSSSSSSYISRLESKYKPGYVVDEVEEKNSSPSSRIARLESKYKPSYRVDGAEEKSSSSSSYISRLESKYKPGYGVDEVEEKNSSPSSRIARLESKYKPSYRVDGAEEKSSSSSSYISRLESKYKPGYGVDEVEEKNSSPSSHIARLESKYKPDYGVDGAEEKSSSSSSYISRLESKYKPSYGVDEVEEKNSSPSSRIASLESKYKPGYGVDGAEEKSSSSSSYISRLESKYKPGYGVDEVEEKNSSPSSRIARLESKYKPGYGVDKDEYMQSPSRIDHHNLEENRDDDIGSEDVGVFTIDDVHAFNVGRKLSTFFSIRNNSLYPGFLPKELADSIPFSSSEIQKILQFFSIPAASQKAKVVKDTIRKCELEPVKGETKICATSLESMLEFVRNALGPDVDFELISTSHPTMTTPILQSYTITEPPREIKSPKKVACHPLPYLYTIYMCHYDTYETNIFKVALVGDNGDKVDALIVCHIDTSAWSPKHVAFSLLGTKPGIPVCHTFTEGHDVWIQASTIAAI
ncbi:hypothetical protein ES319_A08G073100v1 [Gossypium barbadense]|uniref:BURP domain-containing protein n=1 Tax=Gossypium barbadense TaxID=3634 RepID=A0A5J5UQ12_GOSBA|nr:hypothetical protein ES319_A08G073100v1 [Gossypium barbadense]